MEPAAQTLRLRADKGLRINGIVVAQAVEDDAGASVTRVRCVTKATTPFWNA